MKDAESLKIGKDMKVGISAFGAWMLGVGSIIGSMAWLMHAPMLARAGPAACMTAWLIAGNLAAHLRLFPDAYAFLGDTFGFMYAFVAVLYGVCAVSLRYTDPDLARPFRIGKSGNAMIWLTASITVGIWGYAAIGCVPWVVQLTGLGIALSGLPIYYYYRRINMSSEEIEAS
jgi:hypothetical protein